MRYKLDCPFCKLDLIKSHGNEVKMRVKVVKWNQDGMFAVCKACGQEVPITVNILKSIQSAFVYEINK